MKDLRNTIKERQVPSAKLEYSLDFVALFLKLGSYYDRIGLSKIAEKSFAQALKEMPPYPAATKDILKAQGGALYVKKAQKVHTDISKMIKKRQRALARESYHREYAIKNLRSAIKKVDWKKPQIGMYIYVLGELLRREGRLNEAAAWYAAAIKQQTDIASEEKEESSVSSYVQQWIIEQQNLKMFKDIVPATPDAEFLKTHGIDVLIDIPSKKLSTKEKSKFISKAGAKELCVVRMKAIYKAIGTYKEQKGEYPKTLKNLIDEGLISSGDEVCPVCKNEYKYTLPTSKLPSTQLLRHKFSDMEKCDGVITLDGQLMRGFGGK